MTIECHNTACPKHPRIEPFCDEPVCIHSIKRLRYDVGRSRMSPKGQHAQSIGIAVGYWPCVGGPYVRVQLGSYTFDVWYGTAGFRNTRL